MPNNLMLSRRRQLIHFFLLMSMLFFLSFVDIMLDIGAGVWIFILNCLIYKDFWSLYIYDFLLRY